MTRTPHKTKPELGKELERVRDLHKWTQEQFARLLGIDRRNFVKYAASKSPISTAWYWTLQYFERYGEQIEAEAD